MMVMTLCILYECSGQPGLIQLLIYLEYTVLSSQNSDLAKSFIVVLTIKCCCWMKILFSSKQCLAINLVLLYAHWCQEQKQSSHLCPQEQARAGAFYDFSLLSWSLPFLFYTRLHLSIRTEPSVIHFPPQPNLHPAGMTLAVLTHWTSSWLRDTAQMLKTQCKWSTFRISTLSLGPNHKRIL